MDTSLLAFPKPKDKKKSEINGKINIKKLEPKKSLKVTINKISKKRSKQCNKDKKIYNEFVKDSKCCEICGNKEATTIHHIFGASNRDNSTKYGFLKHICLECHKKVETDQKLDEKYKRQAQGQFEKKYSREKFIKIFGKSYL
ncbi:MAG: hypothetical protein RR290_00630 [Clostridia bacterium]